MPNPLVKGIIPQENVLFSPEHDIKTPSTEEVSAGIRMLKNNRAPSEDSVRQISLNKEAGCCTHGDSVGRRTNARGVNSAISCPMH